MSLDLLLTVRGRLRVAGRGEKQRYDQKRKGNCVGSHQASVRQTAIVFKARAFEKTKGRRKRRPSPRIGRWLESEAGTQLTAAWSDGNTVVVSRAEARSGGIDNTEVRCSAWYGSAACHHTSGSDVAVRSLEARMIEGIDEIGSEFLGGALPEVKLLTQRQVHDGEARANQGVSSLVPKCPRRWLSKGRGIEVVACRNISEWIADNIRIHDASIAAL